MVGFNVEHQPKDMIPLAMHVDLRYDDLPSNVFKDRGRISLPGN